MFNLTGIRMLAATPKPEAKTAGAPIALSRRDARLASDRRAPRY
jgi:hypothetical protein